MSRILAKRCSIFRSACLQEARLKLVELRQFSTTPIACDTAIPVPDSILEYRKERENLKQKTKACDEATKQHKLFAKGKHARQHGMKIDEDIANMLAKPTWSVRSLLPPEPPAQTISQKELHHLLRLSALPLPKDQAEEDKMLQSLHSQLHFVSDIQSVNTESVEPLVRIAEETEVARKESTIGLKDLQHVLDKEVVVGRNKRRRRVKSAEDLGQGEDWNVFGAAGEAVDVPGSGKYFVVRSGKGEAA